MQEIKSRRKEGGRWPSLHQPTQGGDSPIKSGSMAEAPAVQEQITELGWRKDGDIRILMQIDIGLQLKKILQRLFVFRTKMFYFLEYFVNIV